MVAVVAVVLLVARALPSERVECLSVTSSPLLLFAAATRGCGLRATQSAMLTSGLCGLPLQGHLNNESKRQVFLYTYATHLIALLERRCSELYAW